MDLSHLDDTEPAPPTPEVRNAIIATAQKRARNKTRIVGATAATLAVAVVVAFIMTPTVPGTVKFVPGPAPTRPTTTATTTTHGPTTSTVPGPNIWLTATINVDTTTVRQGDNVTGTIVFHNYKPNTLNFANHGCLKKYAAVIATGTGAPNSFAQTLECAPVRAPYLAGTPQLDGTYLQFRPGETRVAFAATTEQSLCVGKAGQSLGPILRCNADGSQPKLRTGRATLWLLGLNDPHIRLIHNQVPITITGDGPPLRPTFVMPSLVGLQLPDATSILVALGIDDICASSATTPGHALDAVVAQTPAAGTVVSIADPKHLPHVKLTIAGPANFSKFPEMCFLR